MPSFCHCCSAASASLMTHLVGCETTKSASCEGSPLAAPPQVSMVQPSPVAAALLLTMLRGLKYSGHHLDYLSGSRMCKAIYLLLNQCREFPAAVISGSQACC